MVTKIPTGWIPRMQPLSPIAVGACGSAARQLVERLLTMNEERLGRLRGAAQADTVVLSGSEDDLPWVPGVIYLGIDPEAPHLLVPTNVMPDKSLALVDTAIYKQFLRMPLAILPQEAIIIPLDVAQVLDRQVIIEWLEANF